MYAKRTIFDLVLPRVMAEDEITAEDIARLGEGGLCLNCEVCTFPKNLYYLYSIKKAEKNISPLQQRLL